ncbi:MAG TPA: nucleotide sugar dehydrogenase [Solirubrobacterales bacterium]|nr:nucleotide sugar dehydrogenase [Solirubrobacterales bacterium]
MKLGIAGLGYVGLPLAAAFARAGHDVAGYDPDRGRVERLARGESDIEDVPSEELRQIADRFSASTDPAVLGDCESILICVPTPLLAEREPNLAYVIEATETIASILREGQLVVLESTTYPGTTREELLPRLERSGLMVGEGFFLAYSPERIDPGRSNHTIATTPKVVGGITPACLERAERLYAEICDEIVPVSSPEAAELSKLLENIFRSVNIALVNELAQLTDRLGIDIWEVVDAAASKPFGFMRFEPGPGMGGHCLPVDPFYLAYKARQHDFATEFVELAGKINQSHPLFCVSKIQRALNDRQKSVKGSRVLIVGIAYKSGVADLRESPALKIIDHLRELGAVVSYHDPHVPTLPEKELESVDLAEAVAAADAVAIVTAHDGIDYPALVEAAALVIDFRGVTRELAADNVVLL